MSERYIGSGSAESTRVTLLLALQQGDDQAWRRMIDVYSPLIYGWCRRWGLSPDDACDVSQETFRAAAAAIGAFHSDREQDTFRGWLRTIARSKAVDLWRRRAADPTQAQGGSQVQTLLAQTPDPWSQEQDEADSPGELARLVHRVLQYLQTEFEPTTWQAFWQMAVEGRPAGDIGAEIGLTANAVRVAKCKVLRRLREELGDDV